MDWLRRNWPDLLIGLALIAVIAGIVATLLTGGSFFPLGGSTVQPQPSQPSVSTPAPDVDPPAVGDETTPEADGPQVAVLPPSGSSDTTTPPGAPSTDVSEGSAGQAAVAEPDASAVTPLAPDQAAPDQAAPAAASSQEEDSPSGAAAAAAPDDVASPSAAPSSELSSESSAPPSTPAAASPGSPSLPTEPYRVAVGAFGQRANAEAQAERFRAAGYPVFLGSQGALTLVLVGPYDDEAEAQRVAAEIRSGDYDVDPVIYLFEPDDATSDDATSDDATSDGAPEAADTPEAAGSSAPQSPSTGPRAPSAESEGTRLQVGAYAEPAAAQPQIDRLASLGFAVRSVSEDDLVKLLVGPFTGDALADARVILDGAGIDYFAR